MIDFIRQAGYAIWPVLAVGALATALAARYAVRPQGKLLPRIRIATIATLVVGALGTTIGVQVSAQALGPLEPDERWIFLFGLQESLNNLVASLFVTFVVCVLCYAGAHRAGREPARSADFVERRA